MASPRVELVLGFFGVVLDAKNGYALTKIGKVQIFCLLISVVGVVFAFSIKPPDREMLIAVSGKPEILREWTERRREFRDEKLFYCLSFSLRPYAGHFEYCEIPKPFEKDPDSDYALKYWDFAILRKALQTADEATVLVPDENCIRERTERPCAYYEIAPESEAIIPYEKYRANYVVTLGGVGLMLGLWVMLFVVNVSISQQRQWEKRSGIPPDD